MKNEWIYEKLDDVCSVDYGTRVVQKKDKGSKYYVYGGGGATFMVDTYNREDCFVVARFAMSPKCTRFVSGKFFLNDSGLSVSTKSTKLLQSFVNKVLLANNDTIYNMGKGMAQKNLDMPSFRNLDIPVPPLQEQERIVAELDLLTEIIDKQKQQLKELDTLAQSIFYDMFGSPVENDKNWNINRLGGVLKTTSGGTPSKSHSEYYEGGTIPWVNSGDLHQMYIYSVQKFITQEGVDNSSAKLFPINSVLIAMYGATVGEVSILKIESTTNQAVCCIFPNDAYDSIFLYSVMKNSKHYFVDKASGGAQSNISQGVIKDFLLITPPIELQKSFAKKIQSIESQKQSINRSIAESQKLFDYTMDKYFG